MSTIGSSPVQPASPVGAADCAKAEEISTKVSSLGTRERSKIILEAASARSLGRPRLGILLGGRRAALGAERLRVVAQAPGRDRLAQLAHQREVEVQVV